RLREELLLDRHAEGPVRRTHAPPAEHTRVVVGADELIRPEQQVVDLAARVDAAGRRRALRQRVPQIAVRNEIAVVVGPRARHIWVAERRGGAAWNAERRVRIRYQIADAGALQILADADLQRCLAVAEDVIRGAHARRDVVVAGDAVGAREGDAGEKVARRLRDR